MSLLIILSKSSAAETSESILDMAKKMVDKGENVAVLHIQDACTAVTVKKYRDGFVKSEIQLCALKADLEAKGLLKKITSDVKLIDHKQWIHLIMREHKKIVSWTS